MDARVKGGIWTEEREDIKVLRMYESFLHRQYNTMNFWGYSNEDMYFIK